MIIVQTITAAICLALAVLYLRTRKYAPDPAATTMRQLLLWYPLSAPWLLVRTPILWALLAIGCPLWVAVVIEFLIERPLFFLTAREIMRRVK